MGKFGTQCCAFGCSKQRKKVKGDETTFRSDSEGTDDEESVKKEVFADISFISRPCILSYFCNICKKSSSKAKKKKNF